MKSYSDFEVGKKYRNKKSLPGLSCTCVGFDTVGDPILENKRGGLYRVSTFSTSLDFWEECRGPREFWLVVTPDFGETWVFKTKLEAEEFQRMCCCNGKIIHVREVAE